VGTLRIIAGELRGRRIRVPDTATLRPTGERAREALFSILGDAIPGARVLDAYAGSGAFGIEALSRGAAEALFIEAEANAFEALRNNVEQLGLMGRARLLRGRVGAIALTGEVFDVIFADPPYAAGERAPFLEIAAPLLRPAGILVLEREGRDTAVASDRLQPYRSAVYGRSAFDFYRS
jgi:16S rRNA (guanine966-N2)-methyltransferase